MKVTEFEISGPKLIELPVFKDARGFFTERYRADRFREAGLTSNYVQDNFSVSAPGVLRGLHYQYAPAQEKLVTAVSGKILDVAVDVRRDSPSFGKWVSVVLDSQSPAWFLVPAGFAHGFFVLGDQPAGVLYKVNSYYNASGEGGIRWNDPELAVEWKALDPIVSQRDRDMMTFAQYREDPKF